MNDRHEQSWGAFEARYRHPNTYDASQNIRDHIARTNEIAWEAWCRALDYAAEQPATQCQCYWCNMAKLVHRDDHKGGQTAQCQCDMRTKLVGDGCSVCNPEKAKEYMDDEAPTPLA